MLEYLIMVIVFIKWSTVTNPASVPFGCFLLSVIKKVLL